MMHTHQDLYCFGMFWPSSPFILTIYDCLCRLAFCFTCTSSSPCRWRYGADPTTRPQLPSQTCDVSSTLRWRAYSFDLPKREAMKFRDLPRQHPLSTIRHGVKIACAECQCHDVWIINHHDYHHPVTYIHIISMYSIFIASIIPINSVNQNWHSLRLHRAAMSRSLRRSRGGPAGSMPTALGGFPASPCGDCFSESSGYPHFMKLIMSWSMLVLFPSCSPPLSSH